MDSDAFSISLFVSDFEYIHKNGFTYITLLLFTYTIYQLCILRCLIGYFYNPTKNNRMKKKKKKKKMRSHFHKMITFCLFGKQYMTNKTSIILFLNFFFLMQCMPHIDGFSWRLSHVKPMFSSLTSTSFHSTNDFCGRTNDTGTNNHVSSNKFIARVHHTYLYFNNFVNFHLYSNFI